MSLLTDITAVDVLRGITMRWAEWLKKNIPVPIGAKLMAGGDTKFLEREGLC